MESIAPFLVHEDARIRLGASVGLLRSGGIQGVLLAGADLLKRVESPDQKDRIFGARVIGEVGIRDFYQPLVRLLKDKDPDVRREALMSAARLKNPRLWPLVAENIDSFQVQSTAISSITAGGEGALAALEAEWLRLQGRPDALCRLARIYGRIRGKNAAMLLREKLSAPNIDVFMQALISLSLCGYVSPKEDMSFMERKIDEHVELSQWALAMLGSVDAGDEATPLDRALHGVVDRSRRCIIIMLSFIYDRDVILRANENLTHPSSERRAYAVELIDNAISQGLKAKILPLLEHLAGEIHGAPMRRAMGGERGAFATFGAIVRRSMSMESHWLTAAAVHAARSLAPEEAAELSLAALKSANPMVKETAMMTLLMCRPEVLGGHIDGLRRDASRRVRGLAAGICDDPARAMTAVTTMDKVALLRGVGIFSDVADDVLAKVVYALEDVRVKPGETVIREGEPGDCMYIIASGAVDVHREGRVIARLERCAVFGEFSVLDSEPRSASVTAFDGAHLFRLDQEVLYEIMLEEPMVARGMIRMLCKRLRSTYAMSSGPRPGDRGSHGRDRAEGRVAPKGLLPVEKALILKTLAYFAEAPMSVIADIIAVLREARFKTGQRIIEKGEMGRCMYIVVSGRVRIHDADKTLALLGPRERFGELSLLDQEERTASATAEEDTWVFIMDQEPFYEVLADRIELTTGVIKDLVRQIRLSVAS